MKQTAYQLKNNFSFKYFGVESKGFSAFLAPKYPFPFSFSTKTDTTLKPTTGIGTATADEGKATAEGRKATADGGKATAEGGFGATDRGFASAEKGFAATEEGLATSEGRIATAEGRIASSSFGFSVTLPLRKRKINARSPFSEGRKRNTAGRNRAAKRRKRWVETRMGKSAVS